MTGSRTFKQREKVKVKSKMRKNTVYRTRTQYAQREGVGFKRQEKGPVILEPKNIKSDTVSAVSPSISHEVMGPDAMIFIF